MPVYIPGPSTLRPLFIFRLPMLLDKKKQWRLRPRGTMVVLYSVFSVVRFLTICVVGKTYNG